MEQVNTSIPEDSKTRHDLDVAHELMLAHGHDIAKTPEPNTPNAVDSRLNFMRAHYPQLADRFDLIESQMEAALLEGAHPEGAAFIAHIQLDGLLDTRN